MASVHPVVDWAQQLDGRPEAGAAARALTGRAGPSPLNSRPDRQCALMNDGRGRPGPARALSRTKRVSVGRRGRKDVRRAAVAGDTFAEGPLGAPGVEVTAECKGRRERPGKFPSAGSCHCLSTFLTEPRSMTQSCAERHQICVVGRSSARWRAVPTRTPKVFGPSPTDVA